MVLRISSFIFTALVLLMMVVGGQAQRTIERKVDLADRATADYKTSAAYAEVRLRRAELESDLEAFLQEYTEEYPRVKEIKISLELLQKEADRLPAAASRGSQGLTLALGKLMVRKVELETDLRRLLENLQPAHPDVKRAKRKVEIYEAAIKEILG